MSPCLCGSSQAAPLPVADIKREKPVDFETEIAPILARSCLACHNAKDAESELVLETPPQITKGGAAGPAVVAGKSSESRLFKAAAHLDEPHMPPADNKVGAKPLSPEELGLLKLWIDQGAKGEIKAQAKVKWQPLPPGVNPIYAVAVSGDGKIAACSRANQVFLYNLASGTLLGRLTDPALISSGVYKLLGVADFDVVPSLAFSPDGELLATGGYRTVKLWQRPRNVRKAEVSGLAEPPRSVSASRDGNLTAIGDASGKIQIVESSTGKIVRSLAGHSGPVTTVEFFADGAKLASGSEDKTVRIWNVGDGVNLATFDTGAPVVALALANGGAQVATAAADNLIRVWDVPASNPPQPPKPVKELKGHGGPITALAPASADGKLMASASRDGTLRVWNIAEGREVRQVNHGAPVLAIAATSDGKRLATVADNKSIKLWNGENGQQIAELRGDFRSQLAVEKQGRVVALAKARHEQAKQAVPQTEALAKAEADNVKKFTDGKAAADKALAEKQEAFKKPTAEKEAAEKAVADAKAAVEKAKAEVPQADKALAEAMAALDKAKVAKAAADSKGDAEKSAADKVVADARTARDNAQKAKEKAAQGVPQSENNFRQAEQKAKQALEAFAKAQQELQTAQSAMIAAGKALEAAQAVAKRTADAVPVAKTAVQAAEASVKQVEGSLESARMAEIESQPPFKAITFSRDGELLAAGNEAGLVQTFSAKNGAAADAFVGPGAAVVGLAAAGQRDWAVVAANKTAIVWDGAAEWKLARTIGGPDDANSLVDRVMALAFSPDGKTLATGSGQPSRTGQLKLWNVADGALVRDFGEPHSDAIFSIDFFPDPGPPGLLATAAADRFVKVWNLADGKLARSFEGHTGHVLSVAWKSDGRLLASSGADNTIKIWDFVAGEQRRTIAGATKEVTSLAFLGDGDELVSCSGDQNVRVNRATDGGNTRNFGGSSDFLYSVAATNDGRLVVAGGQDGTLRVWTTQNNQLLYSFEPPKVEPAGNRQAAK